MEEHGWIIRSEVSDLSFYWDALKELWMADRADAYRYLSKWNAQRAVERLRKRRFGSKFTIEEA